MYLQEYLRLRVVFAGIALFRLLCFLPSTANGHDHLLLEVHSATELIGYSYGSRQIIHESQCKNPAVDMDPTADCSRENASFLIPAHRFSLWKNDEILIYSSVVMDLRQPVISASGSTSKVEISLPTGTDREVLQLPAPVAERLIYILEHGFEDTESRIGHPLFCWDFASMLLTPVHQWHVLPILISKDSQSMQNRNLTLTSTITPVPGQLKPCLTIFCQEVLSETFPEITSIPLWQGVSMSGIVDTNETSSRHFKHVGIYLGRGLVLSKFGKLDIYITRLEDLATFYDSDQIAIYSLELSEPLGRLLKILSTHNIK